jgi:hypothetical protein
MGVGHAPRMGCVTLGNGVVCAAAIHRRLIGNGESAVEHRLWADIVEGDEKMERWLNCQSSRGSLHELKPFIVIGTARRIAAVQEGPSFHPKSVIPCEAVIVLADGEQIPPEFVAVCVRNHMLYQEPDGDDKDNLPRRAKSAAYL